jgi:transketolase
MALAEAHLASKFNTEKHTIIDHYTYVLSSDGCMMEGVASEAASLAGHLGLGKLIVFYDSNKISIEGSTELAFTEDVLTRFQGYGWQTLSCDAYDMEAIVKMVEKAKQEKNKPTIIKLDSIIGKGSFSLEGSAKTHGSALGEEEIEKTREKLGIPHEFYVAPEAKAYIEERRSVWEKWYETWEQVFSEWAKENPGLKQEFDYYMSRDLPNLEKIPFPEFGEGDKDATRASSGKVLNSIAADVPNLIGGSADLAPSNKTLLDDYPDFTRSDRSGRNLHFGVREHGMGGITNGIALHGGLRPYCATFLVFADYMRPTIRLAAMMHLPVVYVYTHDSIYVGEDGPTHQPIEQLGSLRVIPHLYVLRPADPQETAVAWKIALGRSDGPSALSLTRQKLSVFAKDDPQWQKTAEKGAYIARDCDGKPDVVFVATGSEVSLALEAAAEMKGQKVRVVSMLCKELFMQQDDGFKQKLIPKGVKTVVAEAGVAYGWADIATDNEHIVSIERFGDSAPGGEVAQHLGLTKEALIKTAKR